jgi:hypothetical protein
MSDKKPPKQSQSETTHNPKVAVQKGLTPSQETRVSKK